MSSPASEGDRVVLADDAVWRQRRGPRGRPPPLISWMRCATSSGLDRLGVELLHQLRRIARRGLGDLLELLVRIGVARPDALEVEDGEAAELADLGRRGRRGPRRPSPRRGAAVRAGRARASSRCRHPRRHACACSARSRCHRSRRRVAPSFPALSRSPPCRIPPLFCPSTTRPRGARGSGLGLGRSARLDVEYPTSPDASKGVGAARPRFRARSPSGLCGRQRGDLDECRESLHLTGIEHAGLLMLRACGAACHGGSGAPRRTAAGRGARRAGPRAGHRPPRPGTPPRATGIVARRKSGFPDSRTRASAPSSRVITTPRAPISTICSSAST